jgi:regulator of protease activity HflC (stomatin/prohibitin superfamily)
VGADATLVIVFAALVGAVAARVLLARVTIYEYQRGLSYRYGRFTRLLGPGTHWVFRPATAVQTVDVRETLLPLTGQELITADGVGIKISLAARYRVADPVQAINNVASYLMVLHSVLQVALREVVGQQPIDQLLQQRDAIGKEALARASGPASELGVELLRVDAKDLMFSGPMKRIFAQVVEARQQGLAALEKARGETAALRNLANAARLVEERPALMQLRLLQQIAGSSGNTVILGMPATSTPIPVRAERPGEAELPPPPAEEP